MVLGGTSLMGGRGSIVGSAIGALTLGVISNGLVLLHVDVYWVPIVQGAILVVAILRQQPSCSVGSRTAWASDEHRHVRHRAGRHRRDSGVTLTHEHMLNDVTSWWTPHAVRGLGPRRVRRSRPVSEEILWDLRARPLRQPRQLPARRRGAGGARRSAGSRRWAGGTILESHGSRHRPRPPGAEGRQPADRRHIIAGTGYYLEAAPAGRRRGPACRPTSRSTSSDDLRHGEDGIRPGIIGEIGVGEPTSRRPRRQACAARLAAQVETGLPVQVHLPGWFRTGHVVLDLAESLGVDPSYVVLCHMGPSGADVAYQHDLLGRGACVQYDMIGMEVYYADQDVAVPVRRGERAPDRRSRRATATASRLLMSQDVFLKTLPPSPRRTRLRPPPPVLRAPADLRLGLDDDERAVACWSDNPRELFEQHD